MVDHVSRAKVGEGDEHGVGRMDLERATRDHGSERLARVPEGGKQRCR
jgi:hypothetical protein